ncbi:MAG: hypothetical protein LAQ69_20080 [Acidobacteriia bacterium]|nr:hypothetical protein [Terriglobia bacterium]
MLNGAMVLMILAGIFGLPAAACSSACAGLGHSLGAQNDPNAAAGQAIMETLKWLAILASFGSIIVGALVKRVGKTVGGVASLLFCGMFAALLIQANLMAILPALMLLVAAIMIWVAPEEQFRNIVRVEAAR